MQLVLLPLICALAYGFTKEEFKVDGKQLPGFSKLTDSDDWTVPTMYAGHLPASEDDDLQYFFWKFEGHNKVLTEEGSPLILWLNGGPGCSSMAGALMEVGPFRLNKNAEVIPNEGSWHMRGSVLFLDQPVGTGFSFAKEFPQSNKMDLITDNFMTFLKNYLKTFPEDKKRDLIFAGESYAGQYLPYFAQAIAEHNDKTDSDDAKINLKALMIGNGWIDPETQYLSYVPFALEKKLVDKTDSNFKELLAQHETCQNVINKADRSSPKLSYPECEEVLSKIIRKNEKECINVYKYDIMEEYPSCGMDWPVDTKYVKKFLTNKNVLKALHVNDERAWIECRQTVKVDGVDTRPSVELLPSLLESGLEIILFNGEKDLICNTRSVDDTIKKMKWDGSQGFTSEVQNFNWVYRDDIKVENEEIAGTVQYERQLTIVSITNGSHMVSYEKAIIARGILDMYYDDVLLVKRDGKDTLISSKSGDIDGYLDSLREGDDDNDNEEDVDEGKGEHNEISNDGKEPRPGHKEEETEHEHDNEEDSDDDSDDENDSDDEEEEEDKNKDKNKPNKGHTEYNEYYEGQEGEEDEEESSSFKMYALFFMFVGVIVVVTPFFVADYYKKKRHPRLSDNDESNGRSNKTVTWANDLENGSFQMEEFDLDHEDLQTEDFDIDEDIISDDDDFSGSTAAAAPLESTNTNSVNKNRKSKPKKKGKYTSVPTEDSDEEAGI